MPPMPRRPWDLLDGQLIFRSPTFIGWDLQKPSLGKDVRMGSPTDALELYNPYYKLIARYRRPYCEHRREIPMALLAKAFNPKITLREISAPASAATGHKHVEIGCPGFLRV